MPESVLWSGLWSPHASVKSVNGHLASCLTDEATSGEFVLCQQRHAHTDSWEMHWTAPSYTNPAASAGGQERKIRVWTSNVKQPTSLQSLHWIEFDKLCKDGFTNQFVFHKRGLIAGHCFFFTKCNKKYQCHMTSSYCMWGYDLCSRAGLLCDLSERMPDVQITSGFIRLVGKILLKRCSPAHGSRLSSIQPLITVSLVQDFKHSHTCAFCLMHKTATGWESCWSEGSPRLMVMSTKAEVRIQKLHLFCKSALLKCTVQWINSSFVS